MTTEATPLKVTVCVGSSCHVRGSRLVLARFAQILDEQNIPHRVSLVGCFCMDRCGEKMNWKFEDEEVSSTSAEEAEATLQAKLREFMNVEDPDGGRAAAESDA